MKAEELIQRAEDIAVAIVPEMILQELGNGIGYAKASTIAQMINAARTSMSARPLATAAVELAAAGGGKKGAILQPSAILAEAGEMAIALNDVPSLKFVASIYGMEGALQDTARAKNLTDQAGSLGPTRGLGSMPFPGTIYYPVPMPLDGAPSQMLLMPQNIRTQ